MDPEQRRIIEQRYIDYKRSITKIGFEAAHVQYADLAKSLPSGWLFELLLEFHWIQYTVFTFHRQPDLANKTIRGHVRQLANDAFVIDESQQVAAALDWFDRLENTALNTLGERYGSLSNVIEGFVHLSTRTSLIRCLCRSNPLAFPQILNYLLQSAHRLNSRYLIQLSEMIHVMIEEDPGYAATVRFKLIEMQLLPDLVTRLTVVYCQDEVDFLNGIFHRNSFWFIAQSTNSGQHLLKIKTKIFAEIEACSSTQQQVQLASAIRALTGLVGYFSIKLTETEVSRCLGILRETQTERLVKLLLSLVLISAEQILRRQQRELTIVLKDIFKSGVSDMPLLLLVYFQTDQIQQIEDMVRSILGMQVPIPKLGLFEMQKLLRSLQNTVLSS
ncbi:uncharacterized protein BYT42DRAFT_558437 [Radiomyces spectabilis]|uniref:uncharacterized protein n=1 Tax=Radiomyces spectabilis TaxID=64574 RepID=UPI00222035BF|nr:uncharacterized protein BYT42DRAFT_558437 [Radiomyces spectabilis]KAI8387968.1 hypothetical protein BYT42DRAFT_558437 [Radiomyces spectabilis]